MDRAAASIDRVARKTLGEGRYKEVAQSRDFETERGPLLDVFTNAQYGNELLTLERLVAGVVLSGKPRGYSTTLPDLLDDLLPG
jgi:hypothetical protein